MDDKDEFQTMFPKSSHRLHLKRVVKSLEVYQHVRAPVKAEEAVITSGIIEQARNVVEIEENAVSLVQTDV